HPADQRRDAVSTRGPGELRTRAGLGLARKRADHTIAHCPLAGSILAGESAGGGHTAPPADLLLCRRAVDRYAPAALARGFSRIGRTHQSLWADGDHAREVLLPGTGRPFARRAACRSPPAANTGAGA